MNGTPFKLATFSRPHEKPFSALILGDQVINLAQLHAAALALGDVQGDALLVVGGEGVERLAGDQLVDVFHLSSGCMPAAASSSCSARIAANASVT